MLPTLISHIRSAHSHEAGLSFSYGIDCCPKTFRNTNTYYKHVRSVHRCRYSEDSTLMVKKSLLAKNTTTEDESHEEETGEEGDPDIDCYPGNTESEIQENNAAMKTDVDTVKVASGHLIRLKCKAGVTQALLPSIVEMNEAVVDSVLSNITSKVSGKLQANGIDSDSNLAREIR